MLSRFFIPFILLCSNLCSAQTLDSTAIRKARLIKEIEQSNYNELCYAGSIEPLSNLCLKLDSLFNLSSFDEIISYCDDTSHVLKFYAFEKIASQNDRLAFSILKKEILDSTLFNKQSGCLSLSKPFNLSLIGEYLRFLELKYARIELVTPNHRVSYIPKSKRKQWQKKRVELLQLLKDNHINATQFEILLH